MCSAGRKKFARRPIPSGNADHNRPQFGQAGASVTIISLICSCVSRKKCQLHITAPTCHARPILAVWITQVYYYQNKRAREQYSTISGIIFAENGLERNSPNPKGIDSRNIAAATNQLRELIKGQVTAIVTSAM